MLFTDIYYTGVINSDIIFDFICGDVLRFFETAAQGLFCFHVVTVYCLLLCYLFYLPGIILIF